MQNLLVGISFVIVFLMYLIVVSDTIRNQCSFFLNSILKLFKTLSFFLLFLIISHINFAIVFKMNIFSISKCLFPFFSTTPLNLHTPELMERYELFLAIREI